MSKHTPGPWQAEDTPDGICINGKGGTIAERITWRLNAALIAAAPEMLEALGEARDAFALIALWTDDEDTKADARSAHEAVCAAIAKATGED